MQISVGLPNQVRDVRGSVIPGWASRAEDAGFAAVTTVGRMAYPGIMDLVALAAAAGATTTIGLLSGITVATTFAPTVLAKQAAGIDAISGGRLRLGIGIGAGDLRAEDFTVSGLPNTGLGKRLDRDLEIYRDVWRGAPVGGSPYPAVPAGTRPVPLLFGGTAPAAMNRMARWGEGYIAGATPAAFTAQAFEAARTAWKDAARPGEPRLIASAYFVVGDVERGRANLHDYYSSVGKTWTEMAISNLSTGVDGARATVEAFAEIGADELILIPLLDDVAEVSKLAEAVL